MTKTQKSTALILTIIGGIYFSLFYFPNSVASDTMRLIEIFAIDEAVPYKYLIKMIQPAESVKQFLINFGFYGYYFYGFPHFALSGVILLPLTFIGNIDDLSLVFLLLRQFVSVVPMILGVGLIVYIQTEYRNKWHVVTLFVFLLTIPAVVKNGFWWHPDSLSIFFLALVFLFLKKDNFEFKKYFYLAAFFTGFTTGIKLLGVFLILTIPLYIYLGRQKQYWNIQSVLSVSSKFLALMFLGLLISNPILIYSGIQEQYLKTLSLQSEKVSLGFEIVYKSDLQSFIRVIEEYFSTISFFLFALFWSVYGTIKANEKYIQKLLISFVFTYGIYLFLSTAPKHQYFLPLILILFSGIATFFSFCQKYFVENGKLEIKKIFSLKGIVLIFFLIFVGWQAIQNMSASKDLYFDRYYREENSQSIQFFNKVDNEFPNLFERESRTIVYKDIQMYIPDIQNIVVRSQFKLLDLSYFQTLRPQVIFLQQKRINDYSSRYALENAIDINQMALSFHFYTSTNDGLIPGYDLLYRDDFGLVFSLIDVELLISTSIGK